MSCSFDNTSNRWRNNETGRYTKRLKDPSELVRDGRVNKADVDTWASEGGLSNTWGADPTEFSSGGYKYDTGTYTIHGHGADPYASSWQ